MSWSAIQASNLERKILSYDHEKGSLLSEKCEQNPFNFFLSVLSHCFDSRVLSTKSEELNRKKKTSNVYGGGARKGEPWETEVWGLLETRRTWQMLSYRQKTTDNFLVQSHRTNRIKLIAARPSPDSILDQRYIPGKHTHPQGPETIKYHWNQNPQGGWSQNLPFKPYWAEPYWDLLNLNYKSTCSRGF